MNQQKMRILTILVLCAILSGCASLQRPPFQRYDGKNFGYAIENSKHYWIFKVKTVLPAKVDDRFSVYYAFRAVGEECNSRGYKYFDVGVNTPHDFDGYCYASKDHDGLGIEFTQLGLDSRPQKFVVAGLNGKTKTQLQMKDELVEVEGAPVRSIAQLKAVVARVITANGMLVDLKVHRGDQELKIKEPIAVFKNSAMGSDVLDLARSRIE